MGVSSTKIAKYLYTTALQRENQTRWPLISFDFFNVLGVINNYAKFPIFITINFFDGITLNLERNFHTFFVF